MVEGYTSALLASNRSATVMFVLLGGIEYEALHSNSNSGVRHRAILSKLQACISVLLEELYAHGGFLRQLCAGS